MIEPYYQSGGITIYHAHNLDVLRTPAVRGIDCVITSPPYNLGSEPWPHLGNWKQGDSAGGRSKWRNGSDASSGIQYGEHTDAMPWEEYCRWQRDVLHWCWEHLPDDGAIFYNHKPRVIGARLWMPLELLPIDVIHRQTIIWSRPGGMNFNPTAFVPTHEWIMVLAKEGFRLKSRGVSGLGDVWRMSPDKNLHPAPFPLELPGKVIEAVGPTCVLDPHMGSGTTLRAAKDAGIQAIGIDTDESYCEMAAERMRQEVLF